MLLLNAMLGSMVMLKPGTMLMHVAHVAAKGQTCPWSVVPSKAMLMSVGCAATKDFVGVLTHIPKSHVDVHGLK